LERSLETTVLNETGLTGRWDYAVAHSGLTPSGTTGHDVIDERPTLFVALEEQLGLRLERRRGLVDVVIVESIHHPSEN
jgi:uncharacterized protein (TIGR03435 family)